jgi:DNA-binding transcriptional regulator LsrR (DeoR family)
MHAVTGIAEQSGEDEAGLATRAAWLYHAGGLTQTEVAGRLGVTSAKAHRLIGRANRAGLVRVFVEGPIGGCIACEAALCERYGLRSCRVVPVLDEEEPPLRALGIAAAGFLHDVLARRQHSLLAVGHGRTLAAAIDHMPRIPVEGLRIVSLLGGLPRRHVAHPFEVVDRLAEKTGADARMMTVPMFAAAARDRDILRRQAGVAEALTFAREATLLMLGIGEASKDAFISQSGVVTAADIHQAREAGARGEALGYFYGRHGDLVDTALHERVTGLSLAELGARADATREVIAVAGGAGKVDSIDAVLRSHALTGLITDEPTARRLVGA